MERGISGDRYLWFPNPSLSPPLRIILDYVVTTRVTPSNRVHFPPRVFGSSFTTVLKLGTNRRGFDWSESRNQWIYRISRKFPIFGKKHEFLPSSLLSRTRDIFLPSFLFFPTQRAHPPTCAKKSLLNAVVARIIPLPPCWLGQVTTSNRIC